MKNLFGREVSTTKAIAYTLQSILIKELNKDYEVWRETREWPKGHEKREAIHSNMVHLCLHSK